MKKTKFKKIQTALILIVLILNFSLILKNKTYVHAQGNASIYLSPPSQTYPINQQFELAIVVDSGKEKVRAIQVYISYPYDEKKPDLKPLSTSLNDLSHLFTFVTNSISIANNEVKIYISAYNQQGIIVPENTTLATIPLVGSEPTTKQIAINKNYDQTYVHRLTDGVNILSPEKIFSGSYQIIQTNSSSPPTQNQKNAPISDNITNVKNQPSLETSIFYPPSPPGSNLQNKIPTVPSDEIPKNNHTQNPPTQSLTIFQKIISFFSNILKTLGF